MFVYGPLANFAKYNCTETAILISYTVELGTSFVMVVASLTLACLNLDTSINWQMIGIIHAHKLTYNNKNLKCFKTSTKCSDLQDVSEIIVSLFLKYLIT